LNRFAVLFAIMFAVTGLAVLCVALRIESVSERVSSLEARVH
jgi:hypothetical protein